MRKILSIISFVALVAAGYAYLMPMMQKSKLNYKPFATSAENLAINIVPSSAVMEGTKEGDLMIAASEGSKIFAKGGLNYVIAKEGSDEIYYSLCSTKIIDNQVNVIQDFNPKQDKLYIFCAHNPVVAEKVKIIHKDDITYVEVQGKKSTTAIALLGNIDIKVEDLELNKPWVSQTASPSQSAS
jgi:hypothetical protein